MKRMQAGYPLLTIGSQEAASQFPTFYPFF